MKFTIADITVTERTVELPDTCPECGSDVTTLLTADDARTHGAYAHGLIQVRADDPADAGANLNATLTVYCVVCDTLLARGRWERFESDATDICPVCAEPAHATESDDYNRHAECQGGSR